MSGSVNSMVRLSVLLLPEMPTHLADDLETVILAANDAKVKLARGVPTVDAIDALYSEKATTARDAVVRYRGPC